MICKLLVGNVSSDKAKEQIGPLLHFVLLFTVVDIVLIAFHVKQFGLDWHLAAKAYHAFSVLLGVLFMPLVWKLYSCMRQRATTDNTP